MNRRGFIGGISAALAGFSILPAATTYTRLWKAVKPTPPELWKAVPNPEYVDAPYQVYFFQAPCILKPAIGYRNDRDPLNTVKDPYPVRFVLNEDGTFKMVLPFIKQPIGV